MAITATLADVHDTLILIEQHLAKAEEARKSQPVAKAEPKTPGPAKGGTSHLMNALQGSVRAFTLLLGGNIAAGLKEVPKVMGELGKVGRDLIQVEKEQVLTEKEFGQALKKYTADFQKDMKAKGFIHPAPPAGLPAALPKPRVGENEIDLEALGLTLEDIFGKTKKAVGDLGKVLSGTAKATKTLPAGSSGSALEGFVLPAAGAGGAGAGEVAAGAGAGEAAAGGAAAGGIAALASNPVGWAIAIVGAIVAVTVAIAALPFVIRDWANSLLESQRGLAEFSGSMAAVLAKKDVFDILQKQRIGEATAGSAEKLEKAYEELSGKLEIYQTAWADLKNTVGSGLAKGGSWLVDKLEEGIFAPFKSLGVDVKALLDLARKAQEQAATPLDTWLAEQVKERRAKEAAGRLPAAFGGQTRTPLVIP